MEIACFGNRPEDNLTDKEILEALRMAVEKMEKKCDKKIANMLPPEPDWRCKCGEESKYTEENRTTLERGEKIKCPKCGNNVKALSLVER